MQSTPIRFGSDHGALRSEDDPLLTGRGQFTDDMNAPDQAYGMFVRATAGHARIRHVDVTRARTMPGVIAVITGADLAADGLGGYPARCHCCRTRRQADGCRSDAGACRRPYPFRRRGRGDRGRRHARTGTGCSGTCRNRSRRARLRARYRERISRRRRALPRRGAGQHCAGLAGRRQCSGRVRLRESRACRAGAPRGHAACGGLAGAACRHWHVGRESPSAIR